jgi:hypothetical protein
MNAPCGAPTSEATDPNCELRLHLVEEVREPTSLHDGRAVEQDGRTADVGDERDARVEQDRTSSTQIVSRSLSPRRCGSPTPCGLRYNRHTSPDREPAALVASTTD